MNLLITVGLFMILVILLLFVWKSRERSLQRANLKYTAYTWDDIEATTKDPQDLLEYTPAPFSTSALDKLTTKEIESVEQALLSRRETCKQTDPIVSYYEREYKNRWKQVKPNINAVGFTPITKRCLYPGAPCEWQKYAEHGLLSDQMN